MRDKVKHLLGLMEDLLKRTHYKHRFLTTLLHYNDKCDDTESEELLIFLQDVFSNEFDEIRKVWTLPHISDFMWQQYRVLHIHGLPEQDMLEEAWIKFRDIVREFMSNHNLKTHRDRLKVAAKRAQLKGDKNEKEN